MHDVLVAKDIRTALMMFETTAKPALWQSEEKNQDRLGRRGGKSIVFICMDLALNSPSSLLTKTIDIPTCLYSVIYALLSHDRHNMARANGLSREYLVEVLVNSIPRTESVTAEKG